MRRLIGGGLLASGLYLIWRVVDRARRRLNPVSLQDKVVLITGAASGIGQAVAHTFAAEGACLILADKDTTGLALVQAELDPYGAETMTVPVDVTQDHELQALVKNVFETFEQIDVLVNNAGVAVGGHFWELDPYRLRQMVETNIYGAMRLTQLVLPVMLAQGSGHIVIVSSTTAPVPIPGMAGYGATKAALRYFARTLQHELAGSGVNVSLVLPGWTRTPMVENVPEEPLRAAGVIADDPDAPALAIRDAVRFNLPQVALGGAMTALLFVLERLAPNLMGRVWPRILAEDYFEALRQL